MKKITLIVALLCSLFAFPVVNKTYLVQLGTGTPGSATWRTAGTNEVNVDLTTAGKTLTDWLTATTFSTGDAIWLTAGTYNVITAYTFPSNISIYGGFAGTETATTQRIKASLNAWDFTNTTIINCNTGSYNCQLFTPGGARAGSVLDGLTIQKFGSGANCGIVLRDGMTMQNCYLTLNVSTGNGGGVILNGGGNVSNCYFYNNTAN